MAKIETPEERTAFNDHLHNVETVKARVRAAESRANVMSSALAQHGDKFQEAADDALGAVRDEQEELDRLNDQTDNWGVDLSGTRNTLSDRNGNFAVNAEVARAGGIGVEGSNSVEGGEEPAQNAEEAGTQVMTSTPVVMGLGGQPETMAGQRVFVDNDGDGVDDQDQKPARKRGSKAARRAAAKASDDEE